ncbi:class E vacuolar protein-sorting machinery protein hse1 [Drosophila willistoni]|uniref:class E vacuolar protein-sorting machinery protein hse1 n=1 Tax=Drosophila willistoni TaxID=7260 RepID=UPI001F088279|nr:class E vacuolar protein-sorting machinery protein hse1 [Drosophila willistoni]
MKVQLVAILVLVNYFGLSSAIVEQGIEGWLKEAAEELGETNNLLKHIDTVNGQIKSNLDEQRKALEAVAQIEELLAKQIAFEDAKSEVLLEAFKKISVNGEAYAEITGKELRGLAQLQEGTKQLIVSLERKLEGFQRHVVNSARGIDQSIDQLTRLVTRAILPQLNGLRCSFDSLETSQINIEVELKNLGRIKDVSENTNAKLSILEHQLKDVNNTQTIGLDRLTAAVKHLKPLNSWEIEGALRELIISQKRIELDLESREKRPHHSPEPDYYPEIYEPKGHDSRPQPEVYPQHQSKPQPPKQSHPESYSHHEPHHQTHVKPVDLVQVWSIAEPQNGEVRRVSAYAESPKPKPKSIRPYQPVQKNPVSWREPLPWQTVSPYQSVPAPAPATKQQPENYRSIPHGSRPSPPQKIEHQPNIQHQYWNVAPQEQYRPEAHGYSENHGHLGPHLPKPKQSAPVHPGPTHSSPKQKPCNEKKPQNIPHHPAPRSYLPAPPSPQSYRYQDSAPNHQIPREEESWRVWNGAVPQLKAY